MPVRRCLFSTLLDSAKVLASSALAVLSGPRDLANWGESEMRNARFTSDRSAVNGVMWHHKFDRRNRIAWARLPEYPAMGGTQVLDPERCWKAVTSKDQEFDDRFFFGVVTTGVYCRPSCRSRLPLRKNVRFYSTARNAEADGLRACLRCRPLALIGADPAAERMKELCRFIERNVSEHMPLSSLAREAGLSPFHFQRAFKVVVGVTPRQYVEALRLKKLKNN